MGIIIESGIMTLIFGFVTSISGIIITNNYNKKHDQQEKKYILTKDIYQKLVSIYNKQMKNNDIESINKESTSDVFTNALIDIYRVFNRKMDEFKYSYLTILKKLKILEKLCFLHLLIMSLKKKMTMKIL